MAVQSFNDFMSQAASDGTEIGSNGLTVHSTLRHEEYQMYDQALVEIARQRLNGIKDLQSAGLVKDLGGLGTMLSVYERSTDMTDAEVHMEGETEARYDRVEFDEKIVPIPLISKRWRLGKRALEASRRNGPGLDTYQMEIASRKVLDKMEDMLFKGLPNFSVGGNQIYGYTNHPDRISMPITNWETTPASSITDVNTMIASANALNFYGPFVLYVSRNFWAPLQRDYKDYSSKTCMMRLLDYAEISSVKHADYLPSNTAVMVQMTSNVVDLAVGQEVRNIEWATNPMQTQYMVYSAMAPRVKSDANGQCGVVHGAA